MSAFPVAGPGQTVRNRILGLAIGLAVACAILAVQPALLRPRQWDLLPENRGTLKTIAFQYTRLAGPAVQPAYKAFFSAIDPSTKVLAVCGNDADEADLRSFLNTFPSHPERFQYVVVGAPITAWCKDRFLVTSSKPAIMVTPVPAATGVLARGNDARVAGVIASTDPSEFRTQQAAIYFDSGDILATQTKVIVSDNLWRKNAGSQFGDSVARTAFESKLAPEFDRRVIDLRGVPDHHIGMFAAPLDDSTVMVGDVKLARPLWTGIYDRALGKANFSPTYSDQFDRAAAQLSQAGFRVIRIPAVYFAPQQYLSYTNAVFETRGSRHIVYMPWYDAPALDNLARAAFTAAGWQVVPIPVRTLYRDRGTIGCLINVLQRG